jgi:hypothetical protein
MSVNLYDLSRDQNAPPRCSCCQRSIRVVWCRLCLKLIHLSTQYLGLLGSEYVKLNDCVFWTQTSAIWEVQKRNLLRSRVEDTQKYLKLVPVHQIFSILIGTVFFGHFFSMARQPLGGLGRLIFRGFTITLKTHHTR